MQENTNSQAVRFDAAEFRSWAQTDAAAALREQLDSGFVRNDGEEGYFAERVIEATQSMPASVWALGADVERLTVAALAGEEEDTGSSNVMGEIVVNGGRALSLGVIEADDLVRSVDDDEVVSGIEAVISVLDMVAETANQVVTDRDRSPLGLTAQQIMTALITLADLGKRGTAVAELTPIQREVIALVDSALGDEDEGDEEL